MSVVDQRTRLYEILRRHVREEDASKTDHDFVRAVYHRHLAERGQPLIDPNE